MRTLLFHQLGRIPFRALANGRSILAMLVWVSLASNASALILTGGPVYSLPGGGTCTVAGIASQAGGATVSCVGVNLAAHTHVYFGIRNDTTDSRNCRKSSGAASGPRNAPAKARSNSFTGSFIQFALASRKLLQEPITNSGYCDATDSRKGTQ